MLFACFVLVQTLLRSLKDGLFADCGLFPLPSFLVCFYDRCEQTLYLLPQKAFGKSKEEVYENLKLKSMWLLSLTVLS